MVARILVKHGKDLIAQVLIEHGGLETMGIEQHLMTPTRSGFLFCCLYQVRAISLPSEVCMHPQIANITAPAPGPSRQTSLYGMLRISPEQRERLSAGDPGLRLIILVQTVFQKLDVCKGWMCFHCQRTDLHG